LKSSILHAFKGPPTLFAPSTEEQIRAELFSVERREQHAESLATAQWITTEPGTDRRLATRLRDNAGRCSKKVLAAIVLLVNATVAANAAAMSIRERSTESQSCAR